MLTLVVDLVLDALTLLEVEWAALRRGAVRTLVTGAALLVIVVTFGLGGFGLTIAGSVVMLAPAFGSGGSMLAVGLTLLFMLAVVLLVVHMPTQRRRRV